MNFSLSSQIRSWVGFLAGRRLAPFHPTTSNAVRAMLDLGSVSKDDTLVDLGCGDGFLMFEAVKMVPGLKCIGYEIDKHLVKEANEHIQRLHLQDFVSIHLKDARNASLSNSSVVTLYLSTTGNASLESLLKVRMQENPSLRVISFAFPMKDWIPSKTDSVDGLDVYLFTSESIKRND